MKSSVYKTRGSVLYCSGNIEPIEVLRGARHAYLCTLEKYSISSVEDGRARKKLEKKTSCEAVTILLLRGIYM